MKTVSATKFFSASHNTACYRVAQIMFQWFHHIKQFNKASHMQKMWGKLQRHYTDFSRRQAAFDMPYSESTLEVIWSASNIPQIDRNKFIVMCLSVIQVTCDPLNMSLPETLLLLQFCLTQYSSYLTGRRSNNWNQWRKHKGHDTCQSNRANQVWWQESATVVETWNRPGPRIWWVFIFTFLHVHDSI